MGAEEGAFDDTVIAASLAAYVHPRAEMMLEKPRDLDLRANKPALPDPNSPFLLDNILKEFEGRRTGYPISTQVEYDTAR